MTKEELDALILKLKSEYKCIVFQTGSRVCVDPPPQKSDIDYIVGVGLFGDPEKREARHTALFKFLESEGFKNQSEEYPPDDFTSFRKGDINFIVMIDHSLIEKHRSALHVCKNLNLKSKQKRIMVFEAVMYGRKFNPEDDEEENDTL